jgi:hypothetical protein
LSGNVRRNTEIEDNCKRINECPVDALECKTTSGGTEFFVYDNYKSNTPTPTWISKQVYDGMIKKEKSISEFDAAANTDCMRLCELNGKCVAAEYNKNDKKCKLASDTILW